MKFQGALEQSRLRLDTIGVRNAAFNGAHGLTGFLFMKADAFGAKFGVDYVNVVAFRDGFVRALGLASTAINAILSNFCGHGIRV